MISSRSNASSASLSRRTPRRAEGAPERCRRHFLRFFPAGFRDPRYVSWERLRKWEAHQRWEEALDRGALRSLLRAGKHEEIAERALEIEAPTGLLFAFEKMALRDAIHTASGARDFAEGLYDLLHGPGDVSERFARWCDAVGALPKRQMRVQSWPVVTAFPFLAQPDTHLFLKPEVTLAAAEAYEHELAYSPRPSLEIYNGLLQFARRLRADLRDLGPRDMIDIQSFLWVQGATEYA